MGSIRQSDIGEDIFAALVKLESKSTFEFVKGDPRWAMAAPLSAPRVRSALELLATAGFHPRTGLVGRGDPPPDPETRVPDRKSFRMYIERSYSTRDLAACEYLELMGYRYFHMHCHIEPPQELWITPNTAKARSDFIQSNTHRSLIVPQRVREVLEAGAIRHLQFRSEIHVSRELLLEKRREIPWSKFPEPMYELWSDLILPRLSPTCILHDHLSNPYVEEGAKVGCILHEGFYVWPEMRYRRSDLAAAGEFDIALTHERFGTGAIGEHKRAKVVSQRFYQYCLANNLKAKWRPVRIEDD